MAATANIARTTTQREIQQGYPAGGARFDWSFAVLSFLLIAGLFVDGWAHFHGLVDSSFFTPWHFLFYGAFGLVGLFLAGNQLRNVSKGHAWARALPQGYFLSLVGAVTFALGGVGDMIWHTLFGIEAGTEALLSPTHIMLAIGMALIVTGPIRAAWNRTGNWRTLGPAVIGATLLLLLLQFFASYAHPLVLPSAASAFAEEGSVAQSSELYLMNADGTGQTRLTINPEFGTFGGDWSPDGSQIVFSKNEEGENQADIFVMNVDGTDEVQLTDLDGMESDAVWSPDGQRIAFIHLVGDVAQVNVINADGSEVTPFALEVSGTPSSPQWSPDGTQLVFNTYSDTGTYLLYTVNADGSNLTALTTEGLNAAPAYSPDGNQITYTALVENNLDIYVMNADGSNVVRLTDHEDADIISTYSADGSQILFLSDRTGTNELYVIPATGEIGGEEAVNLSNNPALQVNSARFSPDGSQILVSARGQGGGSDALSMQDAGVTAIMLQSGFLAGVILLIARRWSLPFGALTMILTLTTLGITVLTDMFFFVPGALIAGLIADVLVWRLKPSGDNPYAFYLFGFLVPLIYFGLYMLTVQIAMGVGWSIHVWTGAIFLAGMVGLLISVLIVSAAPRTPEQGTAA